MPTPRSCGYLALVGLILVATPACGQQGTKEAPSTVTVTASGAPATSSTSASAPATVPSGTFQATLLPVRETRGTTAINVQLPQVTGGSAAARDRFNSGMRAALDQTITSDPDVTVDDGELPGAERSRVTTITPHVLAGLAVFSWYAKGGAHPSNIVATIATNVDTAQPILLSDVFADQQAAADRLSAAVVQINPDVAPVDPRIDNFLNWVPMPEGFHVYVPVIHAMGDYFPVTVPWDRISDLMTPAMRTALIP